MEIQKYFIDKKTNSYYYSGSTVCDKCNNKISGRFVLVCKWDRKIPSTFQKVCLHCISKIHQISEIEERLMFFCTYKIPKYAVAWIPTPPQIANSKGIDIFQAANCKSDAEIIDNTKYSGRSDRNAEIEVTENKKLLEKRDNELNNEVEDIDNFFKTKMNSNVKRIE